MFDVDEHTLIQRTQQGDTQAFNPLVTKYQPNIENLIYGQVHNRETAQDLTQDTFVKAYTAIRAFKGQCAFYTWLYRIAQNVCIDFFRRQHTRAKTFSDEEVDDTLHGTNTHPSPLELLERKELRHILHKAQQHLRGEMRKKVFYLRYTEELSIKEIAKQINRSEGTVKTHLHKAHHQLRDLLRPYLQNKPLKWYGET